jgi:hypothetical protein
MKQLSIASLVALFGVSLVACGGDGGGDPGTITPDTATASVGQTVELVQALKVADGTAASGSVLAMIGLDQGILLPNDVPHGKPAPAPAPAVAPTLHGTASCDAGGCVFDHFGDDFSGYAWEITGTISISGGDYVFALDLTIDTDMVHLHWRMDGEMTVTDTSIDGEVRIVADGTSGGSDVSWEVTVDYIDVVLDASGCPIGGRLDARSIFTGDGRELWNLEGFVTFGPTCGEIH